MTSVTSKNFEDFNNMFKGIDRLDCVPDHIAAIVLNKVKLERNPSRLDDAVTWFDEGLYYEIRCMVDMSAYNNGDNDGFLTSLAWRVDDSDDSVSDIED